MALEIVWSVIPFGLTMVMFAWGASIFFSESRPPDDAMQIYVVGKQWMWKLQHMEGQREINELHIPVGRAGEAHHDLRRRDPQLLRAGLPHQGRTWCRAAIPPPGSQPTKPGKYHLFCAEYCGTNHSAHDRLDLRHGAAGLRRLAERRRATGSLAETARSCSRTWPAPTATSRTAPAAARRWSASTATTVQLTDGGNVKADEAYIRESILQPSAKIVAGYQPIMPTFQGLVTEEGVLQLIEYIKSLGPKPAGRRRRGARRSPADTEQTISL